LLSRRDKPRRCKPSFIQSALAVCRSAHTAIFRARLPSGVSNDHDPFVHKRGMVLHDELEEGGLFRTVAFLTVNTMTRASIPAGL